MLLKNSSSRSRTYVAICYKSDFSGLYFKKFKLPTHDDDRTPLDNESSTAAWYFLNRLDAVACIEGCCAWEDYKDITSATPMKTPFCPKCGEYDQVWYDEPLDDMPSYKCKRCNTSFLP